MMVTAGVADIWNKPTTDSERASQLIYGESVEHLENLGQFSKVRGIDGVVGYMKTTLLGEWSNRLYKLTKQFRNGIVALPFGSYLSKGDVESFRIPPRYICSIEKEFEPIKLTRRFIGIPYLWGGTSDFGFDCSGFTQRLCRFSGIEIPRNSNQQRDASETIKNLESALPGDFVFFRGHVAFYLGKGRIIHANGHFSRITVNDLFDSSDYSNMLLGIMEKIGRFKKMK